MAMTISKIFKQLLLVVVLLVVLLLPTLGESQAPLVCVGEVDGSPYVWNNCVPGILSDCTVTDNGDGTISITNCGGGTGAPTDADYLVGTSNGSLSAEIVVGASPGGELGGSWSSPTIDDSIAVTSWNLTTPTLTTSAALTSGFVLNFNSSDVTITHASNLLTLDGGNFTVNGTLKILNNEGNDGELVISADDQDDLADMWQIESEAADNDLTFNNGATETMKSEADGSFVVTGDGSQSTITEGLVVNNGDGTDADDDFQVKGTGTCDLYFDSSQGTLGVCKQSPSSGVELDVTGDVSVTGTILFSGTSSIGWVIVDQTDNQACNTGCTRGCVFGIENATGTAVTNLVSCDGATADLCLCAGGS